MRLTSVSSAESEAHTANRRLQVATLLWRESTSADPSHVRGVATDEERICETRPSPPRSRFADGKV